MTVRCAFPRVAIAPLQAEARVSSPQTSQAPFGHLLVVLDAAGDWLRVRCVRDGYEGWMHTGYLDVFDPPGFEKLVADDPEVFGPYEARSWRVDPGPPADARGTDLSDAKPSRSDTASAGTSIADTLGGANRVPRYSLGCTVRLAEHRMLRVPAGAVVHAGAEVVAGETVAIADPLRLPYSGEGVVATARTVFDGTSYQWGGVTPWGADCSGFVQTVYALHGVALPRDASQQVHVGADAGRDLAAHAAGDLLFFSDRDDGRITHVGLAAGAGRMLHLALGRGGYAEEDLAGDNDPYVATLRSRFVGARRVIAPPDHRSSGASDRRSG